MLVVRSIFFFFPACLLGVECWGNWHASLPGQQHWTVHTGLEHAKSFSNEWTVEVEGGKEVAELVALEFGYVYGGEVLGFPGTYIFRKDDHTMERRTPSAHHTVNLAKDIRVKWAEQLYDKERVKRESSDSDRPLHRIKRIEDEDVLIGESKLNRFQYKHVKRSGQLERRFRRDLDKKPLFNDELWSQEWYLQDTRTAANLPRLDLNVLPVYRMGLNGSGVRVTVLDDGIEHTHTDLRDNYDPDISWDCNDGDPDPSPRYEERNLNSHGTRCAGEIAMTANNIKCGVGVAWGSKVGGVRMLDGRVTDRVEGEALGYAWNKVDIYSASWGPNDDGRTVESPGRLATAAILRGITKGRGGKGTVYVWANGNGGGHRDNCNCDGYSSSIYTISIGSASQHGLFPWYGEICASTLATAYSSGAYSDQKIATTDTGDSCTLRHTGTSAAAPLAAGIIALALQANPNLTWRDVQHLIVWTSEYAPLAANRGWQINNVGLRFDVRFGFGLLNAFALVAAALNWTTVPEKTICRFTTTQNRTIASGEPVEMLFEVRDCSINYIEHVELFVNIQYSRRGALEIYLASPHYTNIQMLSSRPLDTSKAGFVNWSLTSVATWGENPQGVWRATVLDQTADDNEGFIGPCTLVIHGTKDIPEHMKNGPREYNQDYNRYNDISQTDGNKFVSAGFGDTEANIEVSTDESITGDDIQSLLTVLAQPNEQVGNDEQNINNNLFNDINPTILAEVEKELLRIHHRMTKYSGDK